LRIPVADKVIELTPVDAEAALKTLQLWADGVPLPTASALRDFEGPSTGVAGEFHAQLVQATVAFQNLSESIKATLATRHDFLVAAVKDLGSADEQASADARGLMVVITPANAPTVATAPITRSASESAAENTRTSMG